MNPLYLGTRERRLFAIYDPPALKASRTRAAVLCYPWGSEYVYAHRAMRHLATKLSQTGYHTLRFDFFGTGDSSGDLLEADLGGWENDTASAIEGIKDIAGTSHVTLVGMRIGGSVAAATAAHCREAIDSLVMWDPVVSGEEYLRSLDVKLPLSDVALPAEDTVAEVKGFALSARMLEDFKSIDLQRDLAAARQRSLVLVTEPLASHVNLGRTTLEFVASPCPWREDITASGAVPVRAIQRIAEWLA